MQSNYYTKEDGLGVVMFMGRKKCPYSKKIKNFLKKNSKKFYFFESKKTGEKINKRYLKLNYDYIFCFRSFYILKKNILKRVNKAAINFHPGPPEFRGSGCVNYALYQNSKFYGCTAHLINTKIDNGKIIDVRKFKIHKKNNVTSVLKKTYKTMTNQAVSLIGEIKKNPHILKKKILKNKKLKWSKKIKKIKSLDDFYQVNLNIRKKDFLNKIRATNTRKFKPYVKLYGKKFFLE